MKLKTESDGRMFPTSDNSETVINCLMSEAKKLKIKIELNKEVKRIEPLDGGFKIHLADGEIIECQKTIITAGGGQKLENYSWIKSLGHEIIEPVPSLFTFNIPDSDVINLSGISVESARIRIPELKTELSGPVLITHWGLSGPVVLKLSSIAARLMTEINYDFTIQIGWINNKKEDACRTELMNIKAANPNKTVKNLFPFKLPVRLLDYLFLKSKIDQKKNWAEISKEQITTLTQNLLFDAYQVKGKTTFKEEFVTCGGVGLNDVDFKNMQSRKVKGLHFAGEVLDIDGFTGGFNFQAAWTTGFIAGTSAAKV